MSSLSKIPYTLAAITILVQTVGPYHETSAQEALPMSDLSLQAFILEDGDGDPDWLHEHHIVERLPSDGFAGLVGGWYGDALLFRVMGPNHEGEIIALTPRTVGEISEQLRDNKIASVIVHRFHCGEETLRNGEACTSSAVGMTVLRKSNEEPNLS